MKPRQLNSVDKPLLCKSPRHLDAVARLLRKSLLVFLWKPQFWITSI